MKTEYIDFIKLLDENGKWIYVKCEKIALIEPFSKTNVEDGSVSEWSRITLDLQLVVGSVSSSVSKIVQQSPDEIWTRLEGTK